MEAIVVLLFLVPCLLAYDNLQLDTNLESNAVNVPYGLGKIEVKYKTFYFEEAVSAQLALEAKVSRLSSSRHCHWGTLKGGPPLADHIHKDATDRYAPHLHGGPCTCVVLVGAL